MADLRGSGASAEEDIVQRFAQEMIDIDFASLSEGDIDQLERLLLDYCGVTIGGAAHGWVASLKDWARRYAGSGRAAIIASNIETASDVAAFVNGAAAHSFEFDDNHDASMCHIGAVVIPATLAVASEVEATGSDILAAIAAGYEATARIGLAAKAERVIAAGYHPTPLFGVFGAATAAAKLMGMNADGLRAAWGHALSLAGGSMQFSLEPGGADVKRLHGGHAARGGIIAAQMVAVGVSAPRAGFDGRYGFFPLYAPDARIPALLERSGAGLAIHDVSLKPYACCRLLHSVIDALRDLTGDFTLPSGRIRQVIVRGPRKLAEQHMTRRPETSMAAQYSLPFTVGAVLTYGSDRFDVYDGAGLADQAILQWADRVAVEVDDELELMFPEKYATEVELWLDDGCVLQKRVIDSIGTPVNPMPYDRLAAKVRTLMAAAGADADFEALVDALRSLRDGASLSSLRQPFAARPVVRPAQDADGGSPHRLPEFSQR